MMKKSLLLLSFFVSVIGGGNFADAQTITTATEDDGTTLVVTVNGDVTEVTDITKTVATAMGKATCSKIIVTGGGTINDDIAHEIIYYHNLTNEYYQPYENRESLTELDFSGVTVNDLSGNTFKFKDGSFTSLPGTWKVTTITLPLTKKDDNGDMVVPSNLFTEFGTNPTLKTVNVPVGYTKVGKDAFKGFACATTITLPEGITEIEQDAFRNCTALGGMTFPTTLVTVDEYAFKGCSASAFSELIFPKTLRTIKCGAFSNLKNIKKIKLNDGLEYIGNTAFYADAAVADQVTLLVPSSVKYIGPGAFMNRTYQDIYYLGKVAPIEPMGFSGDPEITDLGECTAFSNNIYMGNNGFNPSSSTRPNAGDVSTEGEGNRENYYNGNAYFCVLHFRGDLTKEQEETFTDITRHYQATGYNSESTPKWSTTDTYDNVGKETTTLTYSGVSAYKTVNTGMIDTYRGKQYTWPSQNQWMRSYIVNTWGYKWDGVTKYTPADVEGIKLTDEQKSWIQNDPGIKGKTATGDESVLATISNLSELTDDDYNLLAYLGTRRHVFIAMDATSSVDYDANIKAEKWQSLCLPCNVTKKQVDEIFGKDSQVCLFSKVERDKGTSKKLHLYFQNDTYRNKYTKQTDGSWKKEEGSTVGDDDIVITANEAYMIYATKNPEGGKFIIENYEIAAGSPLPTVIESNLSDQTEGADHTKYSFIGNRMTKGNIPDAETGDYTNIMIPQYSYFYAKKDDTTYYKFYFNEYTDIPWQPGKCVVERYELRNAANDNSELFSGSTEKQNNAKQQSFFGLDSEPTGIENVEIICGQDKADANIFNLQGQYVGTSRSALTKGVYVQNGKKFVVK